MTPARFADHRLIRALLQNYRVVWLAGLAAGLAVVLLVAVTLRFERKQALSHAEKQADNIALILQKDISRNFELYGLSLQAMVDNWEDPAIADLSEDIKRRIVFDRSSNAANIVSALILDDAGEVAMDLHQRDFHGKNFAERDYFRVHEQSNAVGLFLSDPFVSRMTGSSTAALSRRISNKNGDFSGIALITISADYFKELLNGLDLGPHGRATIITGSGKVVMSYPYSASSIGTDAADSEVFKKSFGVQTGRFISRSVIDGQERQFVVRTVESPTVKILIGFATADIYEEWTRQAIPTVCISLLFSALLVFSSFALTRQLQARKVAEKKLESLAHTDALTGLSTRRALDIALESEAARQLPRQESGLCVIYIDVDFFKRYNDTYGHPAGDKVLAMVGKTIAGCLRRPGDRAGRYGGEEFVVVLMQTDLVGGRFVAEKIRRQVEENRIVHDASPLGHVSISVGIATSHDAACDWRNLMEQADSALYEAKKAGRNRVAVHGVRVSAPVAQV